MRSRQHETKIQPESHQSQAEIEHLQSEIQPSIHPVLTKAGEVSNSRTHGALIQRSSASSQTILQLQRQYGNRYVNQVLKSASGGEAMPKTVQAKMEAAFGTNFSNVRIHEGKEAESIGAVAYTSGQDIHFAPGEYDPLSQRGQKLLGHELAHVVQQQAGRVSAPLGGNIPINTDPSLEAEAEQLGAKAAQGTSAKVQDIPGQKTNAVTTGAIQCSPLKGLRRFIGEYTGFAIGSSGETGRLKRRQRRRNLNLELPRYRDTIEEGNIWAEQQAYNELVNSGRPGWQTWAEVNEGHLSNTKENREWLYKKNKQGLESRQEEYKNSDLNLVRRRQEEAIEQRKQAKASSEKQYSYSPSTGQAEAFPEEYIYSPSTGQGEPVSGARDGLSAYRRQNALAGGNNWTRRTNLSNVRSLRESDEGDDTYRTYRGNQSWMKSPSGEETDDE